MHRQRHAERELERKRVRRVLFGVVVHYVAADKPLDVDAAVFHRHAAERHARAVDAKHVIRRGLLGVELYLPVYDIGYGLLRLDTNRL